MKKISILAVLIILSSCSNNSSPQPTTTAPQPTSFSVLILGKWSYFEGTCGKHYLNFGQSGIYSENRFNPDCTPVSYPGTYSITNNVVKINNTDNIIVSIDATTLVLKQGYQSNKIYTKIP